MQSFRTATENLLSNLFPVCMWHSLFAEFTWHWSALRKGCFLLFVCSFCWAICSKWADVVLLSLIFFFLSPPPPQAGIAGVLQKEDLQLGVDAANRAAQQYQQSKERQKTIATKYLWGVIRRMRKYSICVYVRLHQGYLRPLWMFFK